MLDDLTYTLWRVAELAALVMLPLFVWSMGRRVLHALDTIEYFAVPGMMRFSFLSGAITGLLLVVVNHDPSFYEFESVFHADGPWSVSFPELFTFWLDPGRYPPYELWLRVRGFDTGDPVTVLALLAAVLAGLVVVGCARYFGFGVLRAWLESAVIWCWGVTMAVYVVCATTWTLHVLNFWALVLAFFLYRYFTLKAAH
ncbi:hypothetical protein [Azospirillum sp. A39]|uniref:hypothetical protein n=1 Tax=Azospirillum sp. A39 TaxID=3462279 RepID=UPI0040461157